MAKKEDNNLFKVTNLKTQEVRYYTSYQRIADAIGAKRTSIWQKHYFYGKDTYKDWKIELVDGSEIQYKYIN